MLTLIVSPKLITPVAVTKKYNKHSIVMVEKNMSCT
jgi:hypothetical protein